MNRLLIALLMIALAAPAQAHPGHAMADMQAGFLHPFSGLDHLLVMLAVGLWAGRIGGHARWQLPLTFVLVMALGAASGMLGWMMPGLEPGLAVSVLAMGLVIALQAPLARSWQFGLVGAFALLHGFAHGAELAQQGAMSSMAGMLGATALLHVAGLLLSGRRLALASMLQRGIGVTIAASGAWLLLA